MRQLLKAGQGQVRLVVFVLFEIDSPSCVSLGMPALLVLFMLPAQISVVGGLQTTIVSYVLPKGLLALQEEQQNFILASNGSAMLPGLVTNSIL